VRSEKELECSGSDFTGSVSFSLRAERRSGEIRWEKFMSKELKLARVVEEKQKQTWNKQPWQN